LLAYAAGHLVAAFGNAIENALWWFHGGMPSDWVTKSNPNILSAQQIEHLKRQIQIRFGIELARDVDRKSWASVTRQIYADVMKHGNPQRIDTFNGNYGLNRGLCASTFALSIVALIEKNWWYAIGLLGVSAIYLYRARRFGIHYARELYVQFLLLTVAEKGAKPDRVKKA
jgi:hypothetical protein